VRAGGKSSSCTCWGCSTHWNHSSVRCVGLSRFDDMHVGNRTVKTVSGTFCICLGSSHPSHLSSNTVLRRQIIAVRVSCLCSWILSGWTGLLKWKQASEFGLGLWLSFWFDASWKWTWSVAVSMLHLQTPKILKYSLYNNTQIITIFTSWKLETEDYHSCLRGKWLKQVMNISKSIFRWSTKHLCSRSIFALNTEMGLSFVFFLFSP